ncbi:MAG: MMPL family transporter, partial [Acidimicrobiia bacterium]|nr:MMPL family transporter [Acidimicrobiia bacterium]
NLSEAASVAPLQFVVSNARGGDGAGDADRDRPDVVSLEGLAATEAVRQAIDNAEYEGTRLSDLLVDQPGSGPIVTFLNPVEQAIEAGAPRPATDEEVKTLFATGLEQAPPQVVGFVEALLSNDADVDATSGTASSGLIVAFFQSPADNVETDRLVELQAQVLDELRVQRFGQLSAIPFSAELIGVASDEAAIEIPLLLLAALLIIALLLLVAYFPGRPLGAGRRVRRTLADTGLTLLCVLLAIMFSQGMAFLLGPERLGVIGNLGGPSSIVPILVVGLGVDYAIHLNANYRKGLSEARAVEAAMRRSVRVVGGALVLSSITTIVGFLTNLFSGISGLVDFGIYASVGIASAFLFTVTLFPAARLWLDRRAPERLAETSEAFGRSDRSLLDRIVGLSAVLARRVPGPTMVVFSLLVAGSAVIAFNLESKFSFVDFVPEDSIVREAFSTLVSDFGGTVGETTQVLVRADLSDPSVWNAAADASGRLGDVDGVLNSNGVVQVTSPLTVVSGLITPDAPTFDPAVAEAAEVAGLGNDLVAPDGADLDAVVAAAAPALADVWTDEAFVVSVGTQTASSTATMQLADDLEALFGDDATATSREIVDANVVEAISNLQVQSVVFVIIAAGAFVALSFFVSDRRPVFGLITVLPVAAVVVFLFAFMVLVGIPLGPVTATLAAVVIGVGVDYTIHITHRFLDFRREGHEIAEAITGTLSTTGAALVVSALTTGIGFAVLLLSSLIPFQQFGALLIVAVMGSALVSVLVLPSMLVLWERWIVTRRAKSTAPMPVQVGGSGS